MTEGFVVLQLAWGRCTITATDEALILTAEAPTPEDLVRIQTGVAQRVETIGRREGLNVVWSPAMGESADGGPVPLQRPAAAGWTSPLMITAVLLVLGVHLGIVALLLGQQWAWWTLLAIGTLAVVKFGALGHVVLSRVHRGPRA